MAFLPVNCNNKIYDFVMITADAYVDHPSFGHAIISRLVESMGFSIAIIPQPQVLDDYLKCGVPKYGILISSGVVDSMVSHYTVAKKRRKTDSYSDCGRTGMRKDMATIEYAKSVRKVMGDIPIIAGGIEPSLRRFAHYDYWQDKVMESILVESGIDLIIYGMGERPIREILHLVSKGVRIQSIKSINGTCYMDSYESISNRLQDKLEEGKVKFCPSYDEIINNKKSYLRAFRMQNYTDCHIVQKMVKNYVVANPASVPLTVAEMDEIYAFPYMRDFHPMYENVPAIEEVKFSITSHRGCFGGCNYCALNYHQGRIIQKRSKESIIAEAKILTKLDGFKGYIHDVGGPTANFRNVACQKQLKGEICYDKTCMGFNPCKSVIVDHSEYLDILRAVRKIDGIKKVFIRSGIRYDYLMLDNKEVLDEIVAYHVSGQLKVAPEHCSDDVLQIMNKSSFDKYLEFVKRFKRSTETAGKEQYIVPYFISSHPAATLKDAVQMAEYLHSIGHMPEQVQDFYPTPSTKSTAMYYTGINPDTMQPVYVAKTSEEKAMQRALLQYKKKENYGIVYKALIMAGRKDLIGNGPKCLIKDKIPLSNSNNNFKKINGQTKNRQKK